MKIFNKILSLIFIVITCFGLSCSDDDSIGSTLSFGRSIYILPAIGELKVELRANVAPEEDMTVPIGFEGSAILDKDYTASSDEFVFKSGEKSAFITLTPKDNLTEGREIRLSVNPTNGYSLGDKKVAVIPVEVKEKIMYSFTKNYSRMLSTVDVWVELQGEITGKKFVAPTDITLPITFDSKSTAIEGTDYEIDGGNNITIKKGEKSTHFTVKVKADAEDYAGKNAIICLNAPTQDSDLFYPGSFCTLDIKLDQLRFSDMIGKWKPVEITGKDNYVYVGIPDEDYVNSLPENNGANDYLEFIERDNGGDLIIPHLTGDLKNFFCNADGHAITFDHIEKGIYDWTSDKEYDAAYFTVSGVNRNFSANTNTIGSAFIGLEKVDDDNIIIYFHDFIPTDFFSQTYADYDEYFDASFFGITYTFTRVK